MDPAVPLTYKGYVAKNEDPMLTVVPKNVPPVKADPENTPKRAPDTLEEVIFDETMLELVVKLAVVP